MQNIVIVSDRNELIASRNNEDWFINSGRLKNLQNERDSRIDNDLKAMVSHTTISDTGWKVITYIPLSELFRDAMLGRNIILLSVITVLILSMFNLPLQWALLTP